MGAPIFKTEFLLTILLISTWKISSPPKPGLPSEAKYKIPESEMKGNVSRPSVLIVFPKFSGSPKFPFGLISTL